MASLESIRSGLLDALHIGDDAKFTETLTKLVNEPHFDPNEPVYDRSGDTLVHLVARLGRLQYLHQLHGIYADKLDLSVSNVKEAKRPLHEAAQFCRHDLVQALLTLDPNLDVDSLKRADWSPLMLAAAKPGPDAYRTIQILLQAGANPHLKNKDGWNAFHLAAREGDVDIVKMMQKANPDCWKTISNNGRCPEHTAAIHGRLGVLKLLSQLQCQYSVRQDSCGTTPLVDAVKSGSPDVVDFIVQSHPEDLQERDSMDRSALDVAAYCGLETIVEHLVSKLDFQVDWKSSKSGMSAVHWAALEDHVDVVRLLADRFNANVDAVDSQGRTPLSLAVTGNKLKVARYLLNRQRSFNVNLLPLLQDGQTEMKQLITDIFDSWNMKFYFPQQQSNHNNINSN